MVPPDAKLRLETLRLSALPIEDKVSRLAMIAVCQGAKPSFMGDEEQYLEEFKEAGKRLGLRTLVTKRPPTDVYVSRKPRAPPAFVKAFHQMGEHQEQRAVWLYKEAGVLERISAAVAGRMNEGYALGYPQCCITAYEDDRVALVESAYNHIVSHFKPNGEREAVAVLLKDPAIPPPRTPVLESFRAFPYISHVACFGCLGGNSDSSRRVNDTLADLAAEVSLRDPILQSVTEFLARISGGRGETVHRRRLSPAGED